MEQYGQYLPLLFAGRLGSRWRSRRCRWSSPLALGLLMAVSSRGSAPPAVAWAGHRIHRGHSRNAASHPVVHHFLWPAFNRHTLSLPVCGPAVIGLGIKTMPHTRLKITELGFSRFHAGQLDAALALGLTRNSNYSKNRVAAGDPAGHSAGHQRFHRSLERFIASVGDHDGSNLTKMYNQLAAHQLRLHRHRPAHGLRSIFCWGLPIARLSRLLESRAGVHESVKLTAGLVSDQSTA